VQDVVVVADEMVAEETLVMLMDEPAVLLNGA
jgi:hypothetical protein